MDEELLFLRRKYYQLRRKESTGNAIRACLICLMFCALTIKGATVGWHWALGSLAIVHLYAYLTADEYFDSLQYAREAESL